MTAIPDSDRQWLRHTLATLAYRSAKALRGAPEGFSGFRASQTSRSAGEVLAHLGDLFDWALSMAEGKKEWHDSAAPTWDDGVRRFFIALETFDRYLASAEPLHAPVERLFQGPVADALTHVGQIALLRRLAGAPVRGENYFLADIAAGRIGLEQAAPKFEFD